MVLNMCNFTSTLWGASAKPDDLSVGSKVQAHLQATFIAEVAQVFVKKIMTFGDDYTNLLMEQMFIDYVCRLTWLVLTSLLFVIFVKK